MHTRNTADLLHAQANKPAFHLYRRMSWELLERHTGQRCMPVAQELHTCSWEEGQAVNARDGLQELQEQAVNTGFELQGHLTKSLSEHSGSGKKQGRSACRFIKNA
eukprot:828168-Pelagomonas_calceolata.AAC.2